MADDNKIGLELEITDKSVDNSFTAIESRATKSAKASAAVFGEYFQKQEQDLEASIGRLVNSTKVAAKKSAEESAKVFSEIFVAANKQAITNALDNITNAKSLKKSAQESASAFTDAFEKEAQRFNVSTVDALFGLDNKTLRKSAQESARAFEELLPPVKPKFDFTQLAAKFFLLKEAAGIVANLTSTLVSFVAQADAVEKSEKRFNALAGSVSLVGDVLRKDLIETARGLVDDKDLLDFGSRAIVELGANAARLPETLDLARKSYKVFGGDIVGNADLINRTVQTGNTRTLRQIGLYFDLDAAVKEYAKSLGTQARFLSEAQLQQARLNAILAEGEKRFKFLPDEGGGLNEELKRLKVSTNELVEELSRLSKALTGDFFKSATTGLRESIDGFRSMAQAIREGPDKNLDILNSRLKTTEGLVKSTEELLNKLRTGQVSTLDKFFLDEKRLSQNLEVYRKAAENFKAEIEKIRSAQKPSAVDTGAEPVAAGAVAEPPNDEFIRARQEAVAKLKELNAQALQSDVQYAQAVEGINRDLVTATNTFNAQKVADEAKYQTDLQNLRNLFATNGAFSLQERLTAEALLDQNFKTQALAREVQFAEQRRLLEQQEILNRYNSQEQIKQILKTTQSEVLKSGVTITKTFGDIAKVSKAALVENAGNAFASFGAALVQSGNAAKAFADVFLGAVGQILVNLGQGYILQGVAINANPLTAGAGTGLIAAGAALATFGGVLSALANKPAQAAGGGATGEGGGVTGDIGTPITEAPTEEQIQPTTPKTEIAINIQGHILDRRETGLEIARILEDQFRDQGLVLRGV